MLILKFSFVNCCKQQAIRCHIGHSVDSVGQWVLHSYSSVCLLIRYTLTVFLYCRQYCRKLSFQMQWCFSPCTYSLTYVIKVENNQWFWSSVLCHSFQNVFTENTWWLLKSVSYRYSDSSPPLSPGRVQQGDRTWQACEWIAVSHAVLSPFQFCDQVLICNI